MPKSSAPPTYLNLEVFGLKNQYKIVLNILKELLFSVVYNANENIYKIETIVLYFVIKKNLEISFQNGPEHETTSLITRQNAR